MRAGRSRVHRVALVAVSMTVAFTTVTLFGGARPAFAGHYSLEDVPQLMDAKVLAKLQAQGITTTLQLLDATSKKKGRAALVKKTGQPAKIVTWWANFTDLLRVDGVGPTMARLIQAAGVANIAALRGESAAGLLAKVTAANAKYRVTELLPSEGHLENWIAQAAKMAILVE